MTLFVGGIHAVGKTFVLQPVCGELGLRHATASQLIKEHRGSANWTTTRQVDEIQENQRALILAVNQIEENGKRVVLDGHFVLRRGPGLHEQIAVNIFQDLGIRGVILLQAPSQVVSERLHRRGDASWDMEEIETFAKKEFAQAEAVCQELHIPLRHLFSPSTSDMRTVLQELID